MANPTQTSIWEKIGNFFAAIGRLIAAPFKWIAGKINGESNDASASSKSSKPSKSNTPPTKTASTTVPSSTRVNTSTSTASQAPAATTPPLSIHTPQRTQQQQREVTSTSSTSPKSSTSSTSPTSPTSPTSSSHSAPAAAQKTDQEVYEDFFKFIKIPAFPSKSEGQQKSAKEEYEELALILEKVITELVVLHNSIHNPISPQSLTADQKQQCVKHKFTYGDTQKYANELWVIATKLLFTEDDIAYLQKPLPNEPDYVSEVRPESSYRARSDKIRLFLQKIQVNCPAPGASTGASNSSNNSTKRQK